MIKKPIPLNKGDFERVLLTETLPNETPIIFSNSGLYEQIKAIDELDDIPKKLIEAIVFSKHGNKVSFTIPFNYKIKKDSKSYRQLSLIHPYSQWKIKEFYEKYSDSIIYHCSQSPASIRAPRKIAGSFYLKNSLENLNQYKNESISLVDLDELTKHAPTFFAYSGFNRLYKFFESRDYFELEKKFAYSQTLDVSKCFSSIYTHTMSWAVKDKLFTKDNRDISSTFAQQFDSLMMHSNHNETNGIVIGPEVSRLFAEILLQEVDRLTIEVMHVKHSLIFNKDYSFRRYVDDVFFFGKSKENCEKLYEHYCENLLKFNLHSNDKKSVSMERPFITQKSKLINDASQEINKFIDKFLENSDFISLKPKRINSVWNLTRSFIESIKSLCFESEVNYDEISTFLISVIAERVKKIVTINSVESSESNIANYKKAFLVILDISFFFYKVSPSVSASYKLSTTIILIIRFCREHLPAIESSICQNIYDLTNTLIKDINHQSDVDGFVALEALNIVLTIKELGKHYLLPEETVRSLFVNNGASYFTITSGLFYVHDDPAYANVRSEIVNLADLALSDCSDLKTNSERAYLLLDLINCPFVETQKKKKWSKDGHKALGLKEPKNPELINYLSTVQNPTFHVNWSQDIDLLNYLEKKELKQAY